ncbi:MAG: type II secretion system protein [Synechococcus sp.]
MKISCISGKRRQEEGFSLIEAIAGLAIMFILIATASNGFIRLTQANRRLQARGDAASIGRKVIDELRLRDVTLLPNGGAVETPAQPETIDGKAYDVQITYCPAAGPDLCNVTQRVIQVEVSDPNDDDRLLYSTQTVFTDL